MLNNQQIESGHM